MSRVTTEQARKITSSNSTGYFSLKDDGNKAKVRFMYDSIADIETYAVHEVLVNGFNRHVDCLRDAEGNGNCPFCEKGVKKTARTFFKLYNIDTDKVEIWDCGITRAPGIENILKMCQTKQLVNNVFEIIRRGKAKSTNTQYEINPLGSDDVGLDDLPEAPAIYGRFVAQKTPADMEHYIMHNEFPKAESSTTKSDNTTVTKRVNRSVF